MPDIKDIEHVLHCLTTDDQECSKCNYFEDIGNGLCDCHAQECVEEIIALLKGQEETISSLKRTINRMNKILQIFHRRSRRTAMQTKRKAVPHMCITCQHYEPYHCKFNGYIGYLDYEKCRAWKLSDNYKKGGKFYGLEEPVKEDSDGD